MVGAMSERAERGSDRPENPESSSGAPFPEVPESAGDSTSPGGFESRPLRRNPR